MKRNQTISNLRAAAGVQIALVSFFLFTSAALVEAGQPAATNQAEHQGRQPKAAVPALLLSDIHFEPFWDLAGSTAAF
jgi:hypothetical protein